MKTNHILLILVSLVVIAAVAYMLTSAESPEVYQEKIEAERERQYKFIRFNVESPLTEEQKRDFKELNFYPIDPNYKVKARLIPVENRKVREVPMTDGSVERYIEHSYAEFELGGKTNRLLLLQSVSESDMRNFFLAFADETSGRETYGGGRYINARQDGKNSITIDFNLAYNPYCAYNPDYACPLPPKENILNISIQAGEKNYKD
ncbi:MAG TPA: DUF1684 domain-containing protein [Algoriphagus sp.]|jgi:uncharacterized protein (DUF1684 family)|uniref:DUF1684 domain-containing protein n=1 Tax=unclassified Algoriphagus TaxID=2641541 RepID=UPI000C3650E7|nr:MULTISPECIES: DUF1684 domain-containing protein [unclassified Algoriphagus]MAL14226.1 hypothetical protein [Algoriphagus sp.]MAN88107.1 hypothetical protein [Algoriphagus sp.]QYH37439.1 DUF1684 domain-containing protein [Algoriphagus sp. NBT04N3]HAD52069.1 DUF1684 domain-containing protein [Algoriphagus sp.]HAH35194.1 DUF1684 domain-containing protein [Algoriphagus sp.]|tara:strand:+ start:9643 stop:10260 length:618 start_codon:yes stop_codon:yes gene_type:complete